MASNPKFPHLLTPLKVGLQTVRNRVLVTGHIPGLEEKGLLTEAFIAYHARRAKGGAGLQMSGTSKVHRSGHAHGGRGIDLTNPEVGVGLAELAEAIHAEGGKFLIQLGHSAGTINNGDIEEPLLAPSAVASDHIKVTPKALSQTEIDELIGAYAKGAEVVANSGLDGVEILAAFGFLPGSFFSPLTNERSDSYGGGLYNRCRFALEVAAAIRKAVGPDLIVGMRIPGDEMTKGGLDNAGMIEIAEVLAGAGLLDYLNVSAGTNNDRIMRFEHWPASPAPHGIFVPLAAQIKKAVDLPVFVTGRITDPELAETILERGDVDMVGMTRAHIADPDIVSKVQTGMPESIRPCVGAGFCVHRAVSGKTIRCFHNPEAARELSFQSDQPVKKPKRVAVIGGGPAGLEAARKAAELGHQVSLYEAGTQLGGQLELWSRSPFAKEYGASIAWYERELERNQVHVNLNKSLSPHELTELEADAVIIATGSKPKAPFTYPGNENCGFPLVTPTNILMGAVSPDVKHAVVVDEGGGRNALAAAEILAEHASQVTLVTAGAAVAELIDGTVRTQLYRFLLHKEVKFVAMEDVTALSPRTIETRNIYTGKASKINDVDLMVDWRGNQVVEDLIEAARESFSEVHIVGDSLAPRTVQLAVAEGAEAARRL